MAYFYGNIANATKGISKLCVNSEDVYFKDIDTVVFKGTGSTSLYTNFINGVPTVEIFGGGQSEIAPKGTYQASWAVNSDAVRAYVHENAFSDNDIIDCGRITEIIPKEGYVIK